MTLPLINQDASMSQTVLQRELIEESATTWQKEAVLLSKCGSKFEKITDVANTIKARDYKGFGNQGMNGVIEWKQDC